MRKLDYGLFKTEFGWCSLLCSHKNQIAAFTFGQQNREKAFTRLVDFAESHEAEIDASVPDEHPFIEKVQRYVRGERETFAGTRVELDHLTEFQRRVMKVVRRIGYGKTMSYGDVADKAGAPRAARAVGSVMRKNLVPLVIPCHRVVASSGIGGYSAADGVSMKQRLLEMESHNAS